MPIWCCPTRPISSATTASRCSIGRSPMPTAPADAIRQPVVAARPRRAAVPGRAARSRRAARRCPAWSTPTARRAIPAAMPTTSSITSASPASARSPAGAAPTAAKQARARPIPSQLERYIDNGCFWQHELPDDAALLQASPTATISTGPSAWASSTSAEPIVLQLYSEPLQKFRLAAAGPWRRCSRPTEHRARVAALFRSAAALVPAVRGGGGRRRGLPAACHHAAADGDVPFLGLAECLAAPDPRPQPPVHQSRRPRERSASPMATGSGSTATTAASRRRSS